MSGQKTLDNNIMIKRGGIEMNERKMNLRKIAMVGGMIAMTAMLSAIMMTGCGCQQRTEKAVSTSDSAATADSAPNPTYSEEEQDVLDENLSIDAEGNIVDGSGKQLKVDDEGKVEIKKSDGTVIKVDADTVRKTIEQQKTEDSGSSVAPTQSQQSASSQQQTATEPKTNPAVHPTNPKPTTPKATEPKPISAQPTEKPKPTTADPHADKTYQEAEYEYIQHPAETERVKVVDREAYSYEEPVYEQKWSMICWGCGADVGNDQMSNEERDEHMYQHILNGEPDGYHSGYTTVQTGTKTVNVPEESHYETKIVKEAWTEKKMIRAAGWY